MIQKHSPLPTPCPPACPVITETRLPSTGSPVLQNLFRGRGRFCQSILKSQVASPPYTPVFSALVAVVVTRLPHLPPPLVHRRVAPLPRPLAFPRLSRAGGPGLRRP